MSNKMFNLDHSFGKNSNSMVTIDLDHFGVAVWVDGVVGKSENIK
jgi:hypothetical protein